MPVSEIIAAARRERRVLARVERAAWRLRSAERERDWALVSARTCGVSIRKLAVAAGLSSSRVHQLLRAVDLDALDAVLGQLREVGWLRRAAGWLVELDVGGHPPAVNLRPMSIGPPRLSSQSTWLGWPRCWTASPVTSMS